MRTLPWLILFLFPLMLFASGVQTTPSVIDYEARPRDIIKGEITLTNPSLRERMSLYPSTYPYGGEPGGAGSTGTTSDAVNSWIELSRAAVELSPGEKRTIPYLIHVNYDAKPGYYHGMLWFGVGGTRVDAELATGRAIIVPVNVHVLDDAVERLALSTFIPDSTVFGGKKASFSFGLENVGNRLLAPTGKIRIYDRRGKEVAQVEANPNGNPVLPDTKALMAAAWETEGAFGRYKAILDLDYGDGSRSINDTTFFWVLPWGKTLGLFTSISVAVVLIAVMVHARSEARRGLLPVEVEEEIPELPQRVVTQKTQIPERNVRGRASLGSLSIPPVQSMQRNSSRMNPSVEVRGAAFLARMAEVKRLKNMTQTKSISNTTVLRREVKSIEHRPTTLAKLSPKAQTDGNVVMLKTR